MFNEEGRDEAKRLLEILTNAMRADSRMLSILVMRSDAFPQVQRNPILVALPEDTFNLDMMLEGSYRAVIEGPARLVDPPLRILTHCWRTYRGKTPCRCSPSRSDTSTTTPAPTTS